LELREISILAERLPEGLPQGLGLEVLSWLQGRSQARSKELQEFEFLEAVEEGEHQAYPDAVQQPPLWLLV